jgi:hypothetical protein
MQESSDNVDIARDLASLMSDDVNEVENIVETLVMQDEDGHCTVIESTKAFVTKRARYDVLMQSHLIQFLEFKQVAKLSEVSHILYKKIKNEPQMLTYWRAMCISFCGFKKVYSPLIHDLQYLGKGQRITDGFAKKHFFDDLWFSRKKWAVETLEDEDEAELKKENENATEFKIRVAARVRPGKNTKKEMNLPLHQFLKLRRKENQLKKENQQDNENDNGPVLFGKTDPIEYIDPFLNSLMREPVLLKTSNKICERSIALQCVLRNGRDPFNGKRIIMSDIISQDDLKLKIKLWKIEKMELQVKELSINHEQVKKNLIEANSIDPVLLEILQEAEKLTSEANKAEKLSRRRKFGQTEGPNDDVQAISVHDEEDEQTPATDNNNDENDENILNNSNNGNNGNNNNNSINNDDNDSGSLRKSSHEKPRIIDISESKNEVNMHIGGAGIRSFNFNHVYDGTVTQYHLYDTSTRLSVGHVMNGYNSCILCYGQTGSGKTHTFFGPSNALDFDTLKLQNHIESYEKNILTNSQLNTVSHRSLPDDVGIAIRTCVDLLIAKQFCESRGINVSLTLQYIEIYEENVTDLMNGNIVNVSRATGDLVNASETPLIDVNSMINAMKIGQERKRFAATAMNDRSSRSHTAMVIQIVQVDTNTNDKKMIKSQLHLVDLAGSERVKKSKVTGIGLSEAIGINSSLLVLGKCIAGLVESATHVPYLESKLTTMLRAAFGGNSRTTAIICGRPDDDHGEETLQSFRFGERCSMISNKTKALAQSAEATLNSLNDSLLRVKKQLHSLHERGKSHLPSYEKLQTSCFTMEKKRDELAATVKTKNKIGIYCNQNQNQDIDESNKKIKQTLKILEKKEQGYMEVKEKHRYNSDLIQVR